jgi:hypothetical protein
MFRLQFHYQVRVGEFREFYALFQQLDAVIHKKGFRPITLWGVTVGTVNHTVTFTDYDSISAFWEDTSAFQSDADCMKLWREMGKHIDGYPRSELWESASEIA